MAGVKITELDPVIDVSDNLELPNSDGAQTTKITLGAIVDYTKGKLDQKVASDLTELQAMGSSDVLIGEIVYVIDSDEQFLRVISGEITGDGITFTNLSKRSDLSVAHWSSQPNGTEFILDGQRFKRDDTAIGLKSATSPESVDGIVHAGKLSIYHFNPKTGFTGQSDHVALQAAMDYMRAWGFKRDIDMGDFGFFLTDRSIRLPWNATIKGNAIVKAIAPFTSVTFDLFGGGTVDYNTIFWCAETAGTANAATIGSPSGSRREGLFIGDKITLDCDNIAGYGVFIDNIQNSHIAPRIEQPTKWGMIAYSSCWGCRLWPVVLDPYEGGIWARVAANGMDFTGTQIFGQSRVPTIAHVLIEGDNNGWNCHFGFLEKGTTAVLCRTGTGPGNIYGIDVEEMTAEAIVIDGTGVVGRPAGPVNIFGNFLETDSASHAVVKAINAIVHVFGNRIRNQSGADPSTLAAFETSGVDAVIYDHGNVIDDSIGNRDVNGVVTVSQEGRTLTRKVVRGSSVATVITDESLIHADPYAYDVPTAFDKIENAITSGGSQTVVTRRTIGVDFHTGGASAGIVGLVFDAFGGAANLAIRPIVNLTAKLGNTSYRFLEGWFKNLRVGENAVLFTSGTGTPEGTVTAPIGSLYTRANGGAGTTLYIKESGSGNTGWIAK